MPKVDKEKCIGCGLCITTCPDVFELSSDGKSQVKKDAKGDESCINESCIKEAIAGCPAQAITK